MSNPIHVELTVSGLDNLAKSLILLAEAIKGHPDVNIAIDTTSAGPVEAPKAEAEAPKVEEVPKAKAEAPKVEEAPAVKITKAQVQKAFKDKATPDNLEHMQEILARYGATKISGVPEEHYPDLLKELELVQ